MNANRPYTVVVGVSGTSGSPQALEWGAAQAERNEGRLVAVHAWRQHNPAATPSGPRPQLMIDRSEAEEIALDELRGRVEDALGSDHHAELVVEEGRTFEVLIGACADADLLVVDSPRQLIAGPMFAHRLVYAAPCPVVVMPPPSGAEPPSAWKKFGSATLERLLNAAGTAGRAGYRPPPSSLR